MGKINRPSNSKERNLCAAFFHWEILGYLAKSGKEISDTRAQSELDKILIQTENDNYHNSTPEKQLSMNLNQSHEGQFLGYWSYGCHSSVVPSSALIKYWWAVNYYVLGPTT